MSIRDLKRTLLAVVATVVSAGAAQAAVELRTVSARSDMVSGGDVLMELTVPAHLVVSGSAASSVQVLLNGADVTSVFKVSIKPGVLQGLVTGLNVGRNTFSARELKGGPTSKLVVHNYPITGPIFSGPHESPFNCETVASGLGPPLDANCSVAKTIAYYYRTNVGNGSFVALTNLAQYPANMAFASVNGVSVPYIVRLESGTINRAIYRIAILDDPVVPKTAPWQPGAGWNNKLMYFFDGGCGVGRRQFAIGPTVGFDSNALARGYAVVTTSFNAYRSNCNDVLSAETAMMMKEYFTEQYGVPRYTIGRGSSGGAMQQHLVGQNYPGILDALIPGNGFPDGQTLTNNATDSRLLIDYFAKAGTPWTDQQKAAVGGYAAVNNINGWAPKNPDRATVFAPLCPAAIPVEQRYDAATNPTGVRCTPFESMATYYGKDPITGFAWRALDTVGVQYGLNALNAGTITVDQFLDLNEKIGGFDIDGNAIPTRTTADPLGVLNGFKTGRVTNGKGMHLPILDFRSYTDDRGDVHTRFHTLEMRQRLINANGSAGNQAMLVANSLTNDRVQFAFEMMDRWIEGILADNSVDSYPIKVLRARPAALVDGCWHPTTGELIAEMSPFDKSSACNQLYPYHGNPRTAAGGPITEDVVKCHRKAVSLSDYAVPFTTAQATRLAQVFSAGVCDYSKESMHRGNWLGPWQSFGPAKGGDDPKGASF